jgi:regulator of nucleoside diphosphate kinase
MLRGARMNAVHVLPPITVSSRDFERLVTFGLDAYLRGMRTPTSSCRNSRGRHSAHPVAFPGKWSRSTRA